jgi:hypothetical protein
MRRLMTTLALLATGWITTPLAAQTSPVAGSWAGDLIVQGTRLPLVFHITQEGEALSATMDSPAQGARGIPVDTAPFPGRHPHPAGQRHCRHLFRPPGLRRGHRGRVAPGPQRAPPHGAARRTGRRRAAPAAASRSAVPLSGRGGPYPEPGRRHHAGRHADAPRRARSVPRRRAGHRLGAAGPGRDHPGPQAIPGHCPSPDAGRHCRAALRRSRRGGVPGRLRVSHHP